MSAWAFDFKINNTTPDVTIAMQYGTVVDKFTKAPKEIPPGPGNVHAIGKEEVKGEYQMTMSGDVFRVSFSYGPGQSAMCEVTPPKEPKFDVKVSDIQTDEHLATAFIDAVPK